MYAAKKLSTLILSTALFALAQGGAIAQGARPDQLLGEWVGIETTTWKNTETGKEWTFPNSKQLVRIVVEPGAQRGYQKVDVYRQDTLEEMARNGGHGVSPTLAFTPAPDFFPYPSLIHS